MRIRFTWQPDTWNEALRLAGERRRFGERGSVPGLVYAFPLVPLLGAAGELTHIARYDGNVRWKGSLAPVLLLAAAVGAALPAFRIRRRRGGRRMPPQPCEAVLQETGWSMQPAELEPLATAADEREEAIEGGEEGISVGGREPEMRPLSDLRGLRQGRSVIVMLTRTGFEAIPTVALSPEQGSRLHRLLARKLKQRVAPTPTAQ